MSMRSLSTLGGVAIVVASAACSSPAVSPSAASTSLAIYGASSLKAALAKIETAYEAAVPGTTLTVSIDSSAALETKIEQGAPADVFLSADTANPQKLVDKQLTAGGLTKFAGNLLTVIVPTANPAAIQGPADLAKPGVKVITASESVAVTKYATMLVANLAGEPNYPADFAARYTANIVSKEDNVGAMVAKVELGEGDAAIVYVTDAKGSTKITVIAVPDAANVPATYAGVVVKASAYAAAATAFLAWLAGPEGQAVLAALGFRPAP